MKSNGLKCRQVIGPVIVASAVFAGVAAKADQLAHIGTFEWSSESIVGLSGLEVSKDGRDFVAVSDQGWYLAGGFERNHAQIVGIDLRSIQPILGNDGLPVSARRLGDWSDAEGLAIAPSGEFWISFERWAHVSRYDAPDATGQWIKDHPKFAELKSNRQLEALAVHPDGTVYVLPERPLNGGYPVFTLAQDGWVVTGEVPMRNGFSIVGADFDDAGRLYLLERKRAFGIWWHSRVRRLNLIAPAADEILWTSDRGAFRNLEGIAVWRDAKGPMLTLVSDNNANRNEATEFVEFRVEPSK